MTTDNIFATAATPARLQLRPFRHVSFLLVGCGGTGSHLLSGIATLMMELEAHGISCDLSLCDPDTVEKQNVGRQLFSAGEIGLSEAQALARRMLAAYGRVVTASTDPIAEKNFLGPPPRNVIGVVIGAVDNSAARAVIAQQIQNGDGNLWWLDCGNENYSGQVAIGNTTDAKDFTPEMGMVSCLPAPHVVYPDLIEEPKKKRPAGPAASCATALASGDQGLMVNRMVAAWALSMLDALLLRNDLRYFAVDFDLLYGGVRSRAICEETLKSLT